MWRVFSRSFGQKKLIQLSLQAPLVLMCRRMVLLLGGCVLLVFALWAPPWPDAQSWAIAFVVFFWICVCFAAYHLAPYHLLSAHGLIVGGSALAIAGAAAASRQPLFLTLYAGLPMLAVALVGWPAVIPAVGVALLAPSGLAAWGAVASLPLPAAAALAAVALVAALLTGLVVNALLDQAESALIGLDQARRALEEARLQRLEFRQVEEDLLQATREQTRLLDRLKSMNQIAEEARQAKQEFIAKVSHELRTPLNMIIAYSELMTQSPQLYRGRIPPALLADLAVVLRNSRHLSKLVDDVLDLSQIEAGRMALSKVWTEFGAIAGESVEAVRPLYVTKGLYLECDIAPELPPLYCDPTRIRQVLMNLLSNAGRFTAAGGVRVRGWQEAGQLRFSVADSGPGIAPSDQIKLFEPFQQIDASLRRKQGGSGLGLSISKQFVEMHEGRIWFESEPGQGTTFHVSLPLTPAPAVSMEPVAARRWVHPYTAYVPRTRPRLAPVPDAPARYVVLERGRTLERLLQRYAENVEVVAVPSLEQALTVLSHSPAHAFVVNSALLPLTAWPGAGWGRLPFDTPMIACWLPSDDATQQLGLVRYLVKPVSRSDLQEAMQALGPDIRTVLVCDDEPDVLRLFLRILAGFPNGYQIVTATNGAEALAALRELRPDAVILDLLMPEMTGFELLQAKAQDADLRDIPVIAVSSLDPYNQPIVSNQLFVARGSGLSARDLLRCIDSISDVLAPDPPSVHPALPAAPAA